MGREIQRESAPPTTDLENTVTIHNVQLFADAPEPILLRRFKCLRDILEKG